MKKLVLTIAITFVLGLVIQAQNTKLERSIQPTGGQVTDTLDNGTVVTLDLSSDDAEQENNEVDTPYDDDLDAGWEGAPEDQNVLTMGLRFTDLNIPQGATIDSAYIELHSHEGKAATDVADIDIYAEATDSASTFDSTNFNATYLLTDRPATQAVVNWLVDDEWIIWKPYRTVDIAPVIQEIVDRQGWKAGNAIALIFSGKNQGPSTAENAREHEAFENIADPEDVDPSGNPGDGQNHPERVPKLVVYYNMASSINNNARENHMMVYPNPVDQNTFNVKLSNSDKTVVNMFNMVGETVYSRVTTQNDFDINVSDLNKGIYILRVTQQNDSFTRKLILK
mgnify:CR=1 FL=1